MRKQILYIGNALSVQGSTPTTAEVLGDLLRRSFDVTIVSEKKNPIFRFFDMVITLLKNRQVDYCIIDVYSSKAFYFAYFLGRLCRRFRIPYILIAHGGNLPERMKRSKQKMETLFRSAFRTITPSGFLKDFLENNKIPCEVIRNPIDIQMYPWHESEIKPGLLWVRSLHSIYNPALAIRSLKRLVEAGIDARLTFVGPEKDLKFNQLVNELTPDEQEKLRHRIEYKGYLPKKEWVALAESHSFFMNTTNIDNAPVSVVEAMALGLIVVSTNVGGIPYLIRNGDNGFLVEPNNEEQMASVILDCLNNEYDAKKIRANARKFAEAFDQERVLLDWTRILMNG